MFGELLVSFSLAHRLCLAAESPYVYCVNAGVPKYQSGDSFRGSERIHSPDQLTDAASRFTVIMDHPLAPGGHRTVCLVLAGICVAGSGSILNVAPGH